jgi:hypothetical protein
VGFRRFIYFIGIILVKIDSIPCPYIVLTKQYKATQIKSQDDEHETYV